MYKHFIKPATDLSVAFLLILIMSPVFISIYFLLLLFQKSNPIFTQLRPGKNGKIFKLYKFKTMKDIKGLDGSLAPDNERITTIGRFLRSTSLDEIPQLFNICMGQMSFIGPRPLLVRYLPLYNDEQKRRHLVRPGLSGLAQVEGRNKISWERRFELDVYYVNNQSFALDFQILLLTFKKVLRRDDVNATLSETMKPFDKN